MRDFPEGQTRLGTGRIGNRLYNLDDEEERKRYFEDNRNRGIFSIDPLTRAAGGEVKAQVQEPVTQFLLDYQTESLY